MKKLKQQVSSLQSAVGGSVGKLLIILLMTVGCGLWTESKAQFNIPSNLAIDSTATQSDVYDLGTKKLGMIGFPSAFTSDTVFVQTSATSDSASFRDVYVLSTAGAKIRAHILVDLNDYVVIPKDWTFGLMRYIKIIPDDPEGDDRTLVIVPVTH